MNEQQIASNVANGSGIIESGKEEAKSPFRVVGLSKQDLESGGHEADKRERGRPHVDKTWSQVGKGFESEQKGKA